MKATTMMKKAPFDWERAVDRMSPDQMNELEKELEGIGLKAAMICGYLSRRHNFGSGDQGHKAAVKQMNRNGKLVHMKVFGYNAYPCLSL